MLEEFDLKNLKYASEVEHPEISGQYFLCLLFENGVSFTGLKRSYQTTIDGFILKRLRTKNTNWPTYLTNGDLSYHFEGPFNLTIEGQDLLDINVDRDQEFLKDYANRICQKYEQVHSRW